MYSIQHRLFCLYLMLPNVVFLIHRFQLLYRQNQDSDKETIQPLLNLHLLNGMTAIAVKSR